MNGHLMKLLTPIVLHLWNFDEKIWNFWMASGYGDSHLIGMKVDAAVAVGLPQVAQLAAAAAPVDIGPQYPRFLLKFL